MGASQTLIEVSTDELTVELGANAEVMKESALSNSAMIGKVDSEEQQDTAVLAQKDLKFILNLVEKQRKEVKKPILDFGRKIDDAVKTFSKDLKDEELRIARMLGDYQTLQLAKQRAAEAAMREELLEKERQRQAELAQADSHDQRDEINERHEQEKQEVAQSMPVPKAKRAQGQTVKRDWDIKIVNPSLLASQHPECVNIVPRMGEIKAALNSGIEIAGVSAKPIITSTVRASKKDSSLIEA